MDSYGKQTKKNNKRKNKISKKNNDPISLKYLKKYASEFEKLKKQLEEGKINYSAFDELSTQLLLKIDAVETDGIIKVRNYRKQLVVYINDYLEKN